MCGSPRHSSMVVAVMAIISAICIEFFGYMTILRDGPNWNIITGMVCWAVICAAAAVLWYGAHYKKSFMVLIWLVVAFTFGGILIISAFISAEQRADTKDAIEDTFIAFIISAMFGFFICVPLKYYRTMI